MTLEARLGQKVSLGPEKKHVKEIFDSRNMDRLFDDYGRFLIPEGKVLIEIDGENYHLTIDTSLFSPGQRQVIFCALLGYSNRGIAEKLYVGLAAVDVQLHNIYRLIKDTGYTNGVGRELLRNFLIDAGALYQVAEKS